MVGLLVELRVSSLSSEQIEKICEIGEEAARRHITSKVPSQKISDLSIAVDFNGSETLNIEVDIELNPSPLLKDLNVKKLAEEAVRAAFEAIEKQLRDLGCQFSK